MPGAVPITSTWALTNATMPYVVKLADQGVARGAGRRPGLPARASTSPRARVTYEPVAEDQGLEYTAPAEALALAPALA